MTTGFHSPADNHPVGLLPFGYVNGSRTQYTVAPRQAVAFTDWCINYGLRRPFRLEFPKGGGLWWGPLLSIVTTSPPEEFSSVVGNWSIPPYPLGCGEGQRKILEMLVRQAGLSTHREPVEYCIPDTTELRDLATRFVWMHMEKGKPIAAYFNNGVWWIRT
jgi:hypothetical protein